MSEGTGSSNGTTNVTTTMSQVNQFQNLMMFLCITAIFGSFVQGIAPKKLLKRIPQPVVVLLFYLIAGVVFRVTRPDDVDAGISAFVDPNAIQALFLPVLMFSELFRMNTRAFFIIIWQLLLLVGPGVVLGAVLTAIFPYAIMPSRPLFDFNLSMAFGGMLATTDPIAIIICVNELSAPKRLAALVGGESILNDGTSIVLVSLFLELRSGQDVVAGEVVFFAFNQLFFSLLFGAAMGILSLLFIRLVRDDSSTLTTFVVAVPFLTYVTAAYYFGSSGVLAIIPLGVILNDFGRGMMIEQIERIERLFDQLAFIATGWLYALSGFVVGEVIASKDIGGVDWASLFILYFWINIVRFVMVMCFLPILKRTGYGFSFKEGLILVFGGLRGAVGLTLALFIKAELKDDPRAAALVEFFMAGSIFLMMVNGIMAPFLLRRLGLAGMPNEDVMEALQQKMAEECVDTLEAAGVDYSHAQYLAFGMDTKDITTSRRKLMTSIRDLPEQTPLTSERRIVDHLLTNEKVDLNVLIEQRRHLVRAQRQMYENLLSRTLISRAAWYMLDRSADAQLEQNYFHLNQFRFLLTQAFQSKRFQFASAVQRDFYESIPGKLLLYLKHYGTNSNDLEKIMQDGLNAIAEQQENVQEEVSQEPVTCFHKCLRRCGIRGTTTTQSETTSHRTGVEDPEAGNTASVRESKRPRSSTTKRKSSSTRKQKKEPVGEDTDADSEAWFPGIQEAGSRASGITILPEEWLYNFCLACWGFIVAQQDSVKLVDQMLTVSAGIEAFPTEREALKVEITESCDLPARFLNAVARYYPKALTRIKRLHALSEARNRLFGSVATINSHGMLERNELKRLLKYAEKSLKRIQACDFELQPPTVVGERGILLKDNPNFFPFHRNPLRFAQHLPQDVSQPPSEVSSLVDARAFPLNRATTLKRQSSLAYRIPPRPVRRIDRRKSFSDYDEINHALTDGSEAVWHNSGRASQLSAAAAQDSMQQAPDEYTQLLIDSIHPVDVSRLMETLKLDDSQLKRF